MSSLVVKDLCFSYGRRRVLQNVSWNLPLGESLFLLGPNGCGKTTLLRLLLGLMKPTAGAIAVDGCDTAGMSRRQLASCFSYVPQFHAGNLLYRVWDMVLMGRVFHRGCFRRYDAADLHAAEFGLRSAGIIDLAERTFSELSGGQRQLVMIARALAQQAAICIMDEPESGLDYGNQVKLFKLLTELRTRGMTFIVSTHYPEHILWGGGGRTVMLQRNGEMLVDGRTEECFTAANLCRLYETEIETLEVDGGRFCRPRWA